MKTERITYLLLIITLFSFRLQAQESEIGLNTGFGHASLGEYVKKFVPPFSNDHDYANYFRIGFCYYHTPIDALFTIKTGLNYDLKWKDSTRLNYFRTPIGIDFIFGNKVQFILGGGFFLSYLISSTGTSNNSDLKNAYSRVQLGWYANTGIGFQISEQLKLSIKYQYNADITKMYAEQRTYPNGLTYEIKAKGYDGSMILCLNYKLKKE